MASSVKRGATAPAGTGGNDHAPEPIENIDQQNNRRSKDGNDAPPAEKQRLQSIFGKVFPHTIAAEETANALVKIHHDGADVLDKKDFLGRRFDAASLANHGIPLEKT